MALPSVVSKVSLSHSINVRDVIRIAESAGKAILKVYEGAIQVEYKSDDSPLTLADKQANAVICSGLKQLSPHVPIVSEENAVEPFAVRSSFQYFWLVDPLDGTKEFVKRNGQFTVNIALVRGDTPVLGVVHTPCADKTHWAVEGQGAFLVDKGQESKLVCAEFGQQDEGLTLVASASHGSEATEQFVAGFNNPKLVQLGSSLKLLLVAEGKAHAYPRLAPTMEWDTGAAHVIVTEAGGEVLQAGK